MERRFVTLNVDIILEVPKDIDPDSQEGQDYLREEFVDYLQSAKYIKLDFQLGELDDEEDE